jgi:hypothetical protein
MSVGYLHDWSPCNTFNITTALRNQLLDLLKISFISNCTYLHSRYPIHFSINFDYKRLAILNVALWLFAMNVYSGRMVLCYFMKILECYGLLVNVFLCTRHLRPNQLPHCSVVTLNYYVIKKETWRKSRPTVEFHHVHCNLYRKAIL